MKTVLRHLLIAAILACAAGRATAAEQKIATVDLRKVFDKYYKTVASTASIKQEAADMEKERKDMLDNDKKLEDDWKKLVDKANDQAVSSEERERSRKAAEDKLAAIKSAEQSINEYDRVATNRLREKERQRRDDIVKEIRDVLGADAKAAGYTLVLDVSGESANMAPICLYTANVNDLTDNLIKELNAAAPPTMSSSLK